MIFKRIFMGFLGIAIGLLLIKYREKIQRFTGSFAFAEKYFGSGGTFTVLLITGCIFVIISILYMTGVLQSTLGRLLAPYF